MPRHARQHADSRIYHVMLRGVNRDAIFLEDEDRERFLQSLAQAKAASGCLVLAYCLMTNHVHLVLRTTREPIGSVVKRVGVRYAGWFNHKYGRVGHLFQDRFKSRPVETGEYLVKLIRYVWDNPVEAGLVERADDYRWSSRRLLGRPSSAVDGEELRRLLGGAVLAHIAELPPALPDDPMPDERRRPQRSDDRAAELLHRATGAATPVEFGALSLAAQHRGIRDLRLRSVPYEQISRITGLSASAVKRMHVARPHPSRELI
ncbi:MAG: transposase [Propionibacteriaceae bacterium]|nr:transposase [Propionibacteriaceae bacterium]